MKKLLICLIAFLVSGALANELPFSITYDSVSKQNISSQNSAWKSQNTFIFNKSSIRWYAANGSIRDYTKSIGNFGEGNDSTIQVTDQDGNIFNVSSSENFSHLKFIFNDGSIEFINTDTAKDAKIKQIYSGNPKHNEPSAFSFTTNVPIFFGVAIGPTEAGGHAQFSLYGGIKNVFFSFSFGQGLGKSYDDYIKGNEFNDPKADSATTWTGVHIGYIPGAFVWHTSDVNIQIEPFVALGLGEKEKDYSYSDPTGILTTDEYTISGDEKDSFSPNLKVGLMLNIKHIGMYLDFNTSKRFEAGLHFNVI